MEPLDDGNPPLRTLAVSLAVSASPFVFKISVMENFQNNSLGGGYYGHPIQTLEATNLKSGVSPQEPPPLFPFPPEVKEKSVYQ